MIFYFDRLFYVVPAGIVACFLLDAFIWYVNIKWNQNHPGTADPYSPLFTAIGTIVVLTCGAFLIPWYYAVVILGLFVIFGGIMWVLHSLRWWMRN